METKDLSKWQIYVMKRFDSLDDKITQNKVSIAKILTFGGIAGGLTGFIFSAIMSIILKVF